MTTRPRNLPLFGRTAIIAILSLSLAIAVRPPSDTVQHATANRVDVSQPPDVPGDFRSNLKPDSEGLLKGPAFSDHYEGESALPSFLAETSPREWVTTSQ